MTPLDRDGTVDYVANAVFLLSSEAAGFINGQTLVIDDGWVNDKVPEATRRSPAGASSRERARAAGPEPARQ